MLQFGAIYDKNGQPFSQRRWLTWSLRRSSFSLTSFPLTSFISARYDINWQVFPWQVYFGSLRPINWQVFPWQVFPWQVLFSSLRHKLRSFSWQGSLVQKLVMPASHTFTLLRGHCRQGKLVQLYTRAIKTCQGKLFEKKLVHRWSSVRGFRVRARNFYEVNYHFIEIKSE